MSPAPATHYAAWVLQEVVTAGRPWREPSQAWADFHRRHVRLLSALLCPRAELGRRAYEIRFLCHPHPPAPRCGRVEVALLLRVDGAPSSLASAHAAEVGALLGSLLPDHVFAPVEPGQVQRLLRPFPVGDVVTVARRVSVQPLDAPCPSYPGRRLGFAVAAVEVGGSGRGQLPTVGNGRWGLHRTGGVVHVSPWVPTEDGVADLLTLLLRQPDPVAVSVRLVPTRLTPQEETFLDEQITRCERYAQVGLGLAGEDLERLQPTFRERARLLQQHQEPLLAALRAHAGLLLVEVVAARRASLVLADAVGSLVTGPMGGRSEGFFGGSLRGLAGGHRLLPVGSEDLVARAEAFGTLEIVLPSDPEWPEAAGRLAHLFDPAEAAAAFRLPPPWVPELPGLQLRRWRLRAAPARLPAEGTLLGITAGEERPRMVRLTPEDRQRHMFVLGATLLKTMILDDMRAGAGLCVMDPHGDLFTDLLSLVPSQRLDDVVILDPTDIERPVGLNLLQCEREEERHFVAQEVVNIITRLVGDELGPGSLSYAVGPVFFEHVRMNLLLAMSRPDDPGTLLEFYMIFREPDYWRRWLPLKDCDPLLQRWVEQVLPRQKYLATGDDGVSMGSYVSSKFLSFAFDPRLRLMFGQKRSTVDLRAVMDEGKILLVNLAKGALTEGASRFLGMVVLARLMGAALGRLARPEGERPEFRLYVDEFPSLATESFVTLLSEARKFRVSGVLAGQFVGQVGNERVTDAIFANAGTLVCFRLGLRDAERLEPRFLPMLGREDLTHIANWHACVSMLAGGEPLPPFTLRTLPPPRGTEPARAARVRKVSRARYGRPRAEVEAELARSLRTAPAGRP